MSDEYDAYLLWKLSAQQQIDNFRKETKALRAENAKLREELEAAKHDLQVFSANLARLGAENASLVDVLHEVEEEAVLAFNSLRQDCKTITDSSQHFFEKWWHAECEDDRLKAENAKLRELCADMLWTIKHAHGWYKNDTHEMLMTDVRGRDGEPTNVSHSLTTDEEMYEKRMRELGVEVTE